MAMPITIVGNNFATVWDEKESVGVVLKVQEAFARRRGGVQDVASVLRAFDDGRGGLTLQELSEALRLLGIKLRREQIYRWRILGWRVV